MIRSLSLAARAFLVILAVASAQVTFASSTSPEFVRVPSVSTASQIGSATIDGLRGGSLTVGRYILRVPVGAYIGKATITLTVPDPRVMQCDLDISPASANRFLLPVTLAANVSGATDVNLVSLTTVTRDDATGTWQLVPNVSVNVLNQTVYTPLLHFSKYGQVQGKAGW